MLEIASGRPLIPLMHDGEGYYIQNCFVDGPTKLEEMRISINMY